jgi:hypothetical protein
VTALTNEKYFLSRVSSTFHGRDLFAPVAAHLSLGVGPEAFGKVVHRWEALGFRTPVVKRGGLVGEFFHIDTFGNLISNIDERQLSDFSGKNPVTVRVKDQTILGLRKGYWEGGKGEPIALFGSGGFLEISIREGNAAKRLRVRKGDLVRVQIR